LFFYVISNPLQAVSLKVAPLRINLNTLMLLQPNISPCGRDDSFLNYDTVSCPESLTLARKDSGQAGMSRVYVSCEAQVMAKIF